MTGLIVQRFVVSGKVQGVFFRASTRVQAMQLGLNGYAKNLANGEVEVVAAGTDAAIAQLYQWLQHGPPTARVDLVRVPEVSVEVVQPGFKTL